MKKFLLTIASLMSSIVLTYFLGRSNERYKKKVQENETLEKINAENIQMHKERIKIREEIDAQYPKVPIYTTDEWGNRVVSERLHKNNKD